MKFTGHKRNHMSDEDPTEDAIKKLYEDVIILKNELKTIKKEDKEKDKLINTILEQNKELKETVEDLKEKNNYLERKIDYIYPIAFSCQLRKLLKKLMEYIVNDPVLSSGLIRIKKEILFLRMPKELDSLHFDNYDIFNAFNFLLDIIQSFSLDCDYTAHYVEKKALYRNILKKRINVFGNYKDFFSFFNFDEKYQNILIKLIPPNFFETIDNYTIEEQLSSLISKIK